MTTRTVLSMYNDSKRKNFMSFGCDVIDESIGQFPLRGITELSAQAGCGKTQISLQLALQAIAETKNEEKLGGVAVLSCGEGLYPIMRLSQLAHVYEKKSGINAKDYLQNIHIEECKNNDDAMETLTKKLPEMCQSQNLKFLIIDSLAGLIRFEYDTMSTDDMRDRTTFMFHLAKQLKWLSDVFRMGILVINQVTSGSFDEASTQESIPALGLAWSTCINARFSIHRLSNTNHFVQDELDPLADGNEEGGAERLHNFVEKVSRRRLKLVFSPSHEASSCDIEIRKTGIYGIN